ncbi:hypothetical protein AB6806_27715 [Bosea sp. RCC_152_1]|uniref:hypothetical protein n=1 Tax=Bosea sp. RCC_152_1 TaxID=3239228 RepID=UPI003524FB6A
MIPTNDAPAPAPSGVRVKLEQIIALRELGDCRTQVEAEMKALAKEALALLASDAISRGEAVAWRFRYPLHGGKFTHWEFETDADRIKWLTRAGSEAQGEPLYAHPAPATVEMGGVTTAMIDAAMVEMKNLHPPMRRSECERLLRAALAPATEGRKG